MPKLLATDPVKSGHYNIPYTELFSFMWRAGLERDLNSIRVTCFNSIEDLYISNGIRLLINMYHIIRVTFLLYVAFPVFMLILPAFPARLLGDLLAATLAGCFVCVSYAVSVLVACLIVPHIRWLTLTPDVDPVDFHFQIEKNRNTGMRIVRLVLIIEIVLFFVIFHGCFSSGGVLIS